MTISEFTTSLTPFGIDDSYNYGVVISHINTALYKIYNDIIIPKSGRVYAHGTKPIKKYDEIIHHRNVDLNIELEGEAYSMRICGYTTKVLLTTGGETKLLTHSQDKNIVKGFLVDKKGTLSLQGATTYSIYDLCIYEDLPHQLTKDIPNGTKTTEYDMDLFYIDFACFLTPPKDRFGNLLDNVKTLDHKLYVDADYRGDIMFTYRRRPILCDVGSDNDIDVPQQYEGLLLPLFLCFFYMDEDEDKAEMYMRGYRLLLENLVHPSDVASMEFDRVITNGW